MSEFTWAAIIGLSILVIALGAVLGWRFLSGRGKAESHALRNRFHWTSPVRGKSLMEIKQALGEPGSSVNLGNDNFTYSWTTQNYQLTLIFKGEICDCIESEAWT